MPSRTPRRPRFGVEPLEARDVPATLAVGAAPGGSPDVTLIDPATNAVVGRVTPYESSFAGGVRAAAADLNGDGVDEIVAGPGAGGGPRVQVIDGATRQVVASFFAFEPTFTGGVNVAVGDVDGDGRPEIVVGAGAGGGPRVRTFATRADPMTGAVAVATTPASDFFAYEDGFRGGVLVAAGDVDGDGADEIILGTGVGGSPRVRAVRGGGAEVRNFFAYEDTARGGVSVAAADVDGDGRVEIVVGAGAGGGPRVRAFGERAVIADFFAFPDGFRGGVGVMAAGNDIVAVATTISQRVRRFDARGNQLAEVVLAAAVPAPPAVPGEPALTAADVDALLRRAAAASVSQDAIIAVVDRNGRILGVRAEAGVAPEVMNDPEKLVFAVDGAVAKARTGAFFASDEAPLTSRTVQFISQSTITQREVESDPNVTDPNATARGPGFVAPVGIKAHFPPGVAFTPQVDLFQIEHTNRDGTFHPGADRVKGTADDIRLQRRFGIDPAFVPTGPNGPKNLSPPDSYGFASGLLPGAQGRGVATLPGGVPLYKDDRVVGGIGVFFPGTTGFATAENSSLSSTFDPAKADRALEAEFVAFAAAGGVRGFAPVEALGGVDRPAGVQIPGTDRFGELRIDLVGIQVEVFGPGGREAGRDVLLGVGAAVGAGRGDTDGGRNLAVSAGPDDLPGTADDVRLQDGRPVPDGWLVAPHDGNGISAAEVERVVTDGIAQAVRTRAAIRLPVGTRAKFVFAVADRDGEIVGLFRMPDATIFSIDVAVAKARNAAYYANAARLQAVDRVDGVPAGTALTARTFRYLGEPRFPNGIDGSPPGPFSQLNDDPGTDPLTGLQVGPRRPASAYQSVVGFDAFNPGSNFRDPGDPTLQNGVVFFPGSVPLYSGGALAGGVGVSGDGVDQDDVTTFGASQNFGVPDELLRADETFVRGVRLPYQKFNRNPEG